MAHEIVVDVSTELARHKDVEIAVKKDGRKLGTVLVSRGGIEWRPAGDSVNGKRLPWSKLADLIAARGRNVRGG